MKLSFATTFVMVGALLSGGCATKKFVRQTVDPVSGKLNQVADQANKTGQTLDETRQTIQKDETELSATKERAMTADNRAGEALNKAGDAANRADTANQKADQVGRDLGDLRSTVANLDDYKQVGQTTVNFSFNGAKLTNDAKTQLDQMVANQGQFKRYFIAVEGFTDTVGSTEYNAALSRRRADAVTEYLVAQHNIPIYRIHMIGLGKLKPVEDARSKSARAKNRRVEVTLFSADQNAVAMNSGSGSQGNSASGASVNGNFGAGSASQGNSSTRQQGNGSSQQ